MTASSLDTLFGTFRRTGDPEALAAVFDATASELLLVAVHLVGDRADAEDLVQATFVELIESADSYDPSRPFKPWLFGVLANRAKMARRRRRQRTTLDLEATQANDPSTDPGTGPAAHAEASEVAERIFGAIEALPSAYRHILVLHLVHGLGGVQIAQSLDRPPATVRTQIKRGLEMLRGALPTTALAVPLGLLALEGRGLAAVKLAVVSHAKAAVVIGATAASAPATVSLVSALGAIIIMNKTWIAATAAAVVLGLGAWLLGNPAVADRPNVDERDRGVESKTADASADSADAQVPRVAERVAVDESPADRATAADDGSRVTVRGRVVGVVDGRPRVATSIRLTSMRRRLILGDPDSLRPTTVWEGATDTLGVFEFDCSFDPQNRHSLELSGPRFVLVAGSVELDRDAAASAEGGDRVLDLGDLRVQGGARLAVRVVDESGEPIPNVWFGVTSQSASFRGPSAGQVTTSAQTDGLGILRMDGDARLCAGRVLLSAPESYEIVESATFQIPEGVDTAVPTVVMRLVGRDRQIRGKVVDEQGVGIAKARVQFRERRGEYVRADRDGRFTLYREPGEPDQVQLWALATDSHAFGQSKHVDWGSEGVTLVQPPAREVTLQVLDAETREPVERFRVFFGASEDSSWGSRGLEESVIVIDSAEKRGLVTIKRLPVGGDGALSYAVLPGTDDYEMSAQTQIPLSDLPADGRPIEVLLVPRHAVKVRVVDPMGAGVAASTVRVVQLQEGAVLDASTFVLPREIAWQNFTPSDRAKVRVSFVVDQGDTDGAGRASLRCPADPRRLGVMVSGATHAPVFVSPVDFSGDRSLEVVVEPGASLRCRIVDADLLQNFARHPEDRTPTSVQIAIRRSGESITPPPGARMVGYPISDSGEVVIGGLEPGRWEVVLHWMRPLLEGTMQSHTAEPPLAVVNLQPSAEFDLEARIAPLAPALMRGVLREAGVPIRGGKVTVRHIHEGGHTSSIGGGRTDDQGAWSTGGLLEGRVQLEVVLTEVRGGERKLYSEWIPLRAGAVIERDHELTEG